MISQSNKSGRSEMKMMNRFGSAAILVSAFLAAGCAQSQSDAPVAAIEAKVETTTKVQLVQPATIKPGAAVSFTHKARSAVQPGENGTLDLTLIEGYPAGNLTLGITGSDGLVVSTAQSGQSLSMKGADSHQISVTYRAETNGVFYVNVLAKTDTLDGVTSARAYSARVEIGDVTGLEKPKTDLPLDTNASGETVIIMEAEETIR